jgi:hypothetical protein
MTDVQYKLYSDGKARNLQRCVTYYSTGTVRGHSTHTHIWHYTVVVADGGKLRWCVSLDYSTVPVRQGLIHSTGTALHHNMLTDFRRTK